MCGIAGIHRLTDRPGKSLNRLADNLLLGIAHRGSDATGYLALSDDGSLTVHKATLPCLAFIHKRPAFDKAARTVLLHTRFATRGAADDPANAHPVQAGRIAAVHNGTIYNDQQLFREYGMARTADVDSIVIPALVDRLGWGQARNALGKLSGGAATAVVNADRPGEMILARVRTYPMHVLVTKDVLVFASERQAIVLAWKATYGHAPRGRWITLGERQMLRVNGKVDLLPLAAPKPKRKQQPKRKPVAPRPTASTAQLPLAAQPKPRRRPAPVTDDLLVENEVRWAQTFLGLDYATAYEEVTGTTYDDAYDELHRVAAAEDEWMWDDDMIVTKGGQR